MNKLTGLICFVVWFSASVAFCQDQVPTADRQAVSGHAYTIVEQNNDEVVATETLSDGTTQRTAIPTNGTYRSPTLRGRFFAQWMYIVQNGQVVQFWGARIVRLDADSPLRTLGVRSGDVITRLDGIPIWNRMFRQAGQPWQIIQMEQHFGLTEVRFIQQGTNRVRVGQINLDSHDDDVVPVRP